MRWTVRGWRKIVLTFISFFSFSLGKLYRLRLYRNSQNWVHKLSLNALLKPSLGKLFRHNFSLKIFAKNLTFNEWRNFKRKMFMDVDDWIAICFTLDSAQGAQQKIDSSGEDFRSLCNWASFVFMSDKSKESKCAQQQTRAEQISKRCQVWNCWCVWVYLESPHCMNYHVGNEEE